MDKKDLDNMLLKDTKAKRVDSSVYGTINSVSNYHPIHKFKINGIELGELFDTNNKSHDELLEKIKILKEVVLSQSKEIKYIKSILTKFGLE